MTQPEEDSDLAARYAHVAVLVPCLDEAVTVAKVVADFQRALPGATVYVFDNDSTDGTGERAKEAGAVVIHSPRRGKGNVVRHMFRVVDAEIYVMVDGDDTYPAAAAPDLLAKFEHTGADMVVGVRTSATATGAFRRFHRLGNWLMARLISVLFRASVSDVLSGYRVLSRSLVVSLPLCSEGFSIETELTLQVLAKQFVLEEVPVAYGSRPAGSRSKLSTFSDGLVVLKALAMLFKDYKPLVFFGSLAVLLGLLSLAAGTLPVLDYVHYRFVYHVPLAILAAAIGILATLCLGVGLILDTAARYQRETFAVLRKLAERPGGQVPESRRDDQPPTTPA